MPPVIEAPFPRGTCPMQVWDEPGKRAPVILFLMDAFGPRPALFDLAERFAREGYHVLLPHLFYQYLPFTPFDPAEVVKGKEELARLMTMFQSIKQPHVDADVQAMLSLIAARYGADVPIGCVGYCMGGRYALTAATTSKQVVYAGSLHGSILAPENEDGAHRRFAGVKARIYIGVADDDHLFEGPEEGRLAAALREARIDHTIETYAGAGHGFALNDLSTFDRAATEHHFRRVFSDLADMVARAARR